MTPAPGERGPGKLGKAERTIVVKRREMARVESHARDLYPGECCGVLVGKRDDRTVVVAAHPTWNRRRAQACDRYEIHPRELLRLDRAAAREGMEIVGFYHSHPDHPPVPSPTDAAQAWSGYVYLIVGVAADGNTEAKAWTYDEERSRFEEWPIQVDSRLPLGEPTVAPARR